MVCSISNLQDIESHQLTAKDKTGKTALHIAVERNRIELVTVLLSHGAKGNIKDNHDKTPLDYQTELLKDTDTAKLAKQIRSRIQRGNVLE